MASNRQETRSIFLVGIPPIPLQVHFEQGQLPELPLEFPVFELL
jgi:hypothetical protein